MTLLGIEFAPLNVPFRRRLQTLAAAAWFVTMVFAGILCLILAIYMVLFTQLRWPTLIYLFWAWVIDKDTCERGGRPVQWVRSWSWWKYFRDYFPIRLERVPWVELDPKRNYFFCCFPHGMLSTGPFVVFATNYGGFQEFFPHHQPFAITLNQHFHMPFFRELAYSLGGCCASAKSISYLLSKPGGGNAVGLVVGGAAETYYCKPGQYRILLRKRKGFIKLALRCGSPLVPVISFGETDLFSQIEGSWLRKCQEFVRGLIGIAPAIPLGRGFFQYSFGLVPRRRPVTCLVGTPIDVEKVENPTREQVDELHTKFIEHLTHLFETEKHRYLKDAENIKLIMD